MTSHEDQEKLGTFPFVIAGLSFIPLIGVIFGAVAIMWGLLTKRPGGKKLALIGTGGIVFTIALYSALFYFGAIQRGGVYDQLRENLAISSTARIVYAIEFYKAQNGKYPKSLPDLVDSLPESATVNINDPSALSPSGDPVPFHYELVTEETYYLLGVGPDGEKFTKDDILPRIDIVPGSKVGFRTKE